MEKEKPGYENIFILFDPDKKTFLTQFCEQLVGEADEGKGILERFLKSKEAQALPMEIHDAIATNHYSCLGIGFAVGYVVGQDYDIGDKETLSVVKALRGRLAEAKALPYFRRIEDKREPQSPPAR